MSPHLSARVPLARCRHAHRIENALELHRLAELYERNVVVECRLRVTRVLRDLLNLRKIARLSHKSIDFILLRFYAACYRHRLGVIRSVVLEQSHRYALLAETADTVRCRLELVVVCDDNFDGSRGCALNLLTVGMTRRRLRHFYGLRFSDNFHLPMT
jgi:hypothetical protein